MKKSKQKSAEKLNQLKGDRTQTIKQVGEAVPTQNSQNSGGNNSFVFTNVSASTHSSSEAFIIHFFKIQKQKS